MFNKLSESFKSPDLILVYEFVAVNKNFTPLHFAARDKRGSHANDEPADQFNFLA